MGIGGEGWGVATSRHAGLSLVCDKMPELSQQRHVQEYTHQRTGSSCIDKKAETKAKLNS